MDVKALIRQKVLGIPFLYLAAGVAVAAFAWSFYQRGNSKPTGDGTAAGDVADPGTDIGGDPANISPTGALVANTNPQGNSSGFVQDSNDLWAARARSWLMANKGLGAGDAQNLVYAYLNGETLSFDQGKLRDAMIAAVGFPPEPPTNSPTLKGTPHGGFIRFGDGLHITNVNVDRSLGKFTVHWGPGVGAKTYIVTYDGKGVARLSPDKREATLPIPGGKPRAVGTAVTIGVEARGNSQEIRRVAANTKIRD